MKHLSLAISLAGVCSLAAPALASDCSVTDISPTAIACAGGYDKNILDNNSGDVALQKEALAALGYTWDGLHFDALPKLSSLHGATSINFDGLLYGITYVGIHVGSKHGGQTTFYKFDAGTSLDAFTLHLPSSSGAVLYSTGAPASPAPEPASWALMLGGFGLVGAAMRSRRKTAGTFALAHPPQG